MFGKITDSIRRFMVGRYGIDQLGIALVVVGMVASLLTGLLRWRWLYLLYWVVVFLCFWRVLSRNIDKRMHENQQFLRWWSPVQQKLSTIPSTVAQRKQYVLFKCPHCGQKLRLPRGKGTVVVNCHRCNTKFEKKS